MASTTYSDNMEPCEVAAGCQVKPAQQPAPTTCTTDQQVLAAIWSHIEQLLSSAHSSAHASISQLTSRLQQLDTLPSDALASIAHLQLNSAGHLMATAKLLAPGAFEQQLEGGCCEPQLDILAAVPEPAVAMVTTLIDLQLFCLDRARQVTTEMRRRIALKRIAALQQLEQEALHRMMMMAATTASTSLNGGALSDDSMVESLE